MLWSFWPLGTCSPTSLLHQTLSVLLAPAGRSTLECIRAPPHLPPAWLRHHLEQNLLGMVLAFLKRCFRHSASQNRIPFSIFFFFLSKPKPIPSHLISVATLHGFSRWILWLFTAENAPSSMFPSIPQKSQA